MERVDDRRVDRQGERHEGEINAAHGAEPDRFTPSRSGARRNLDPSTTERWLSFDKTA
jgi:hypothetical protein